RPAGTEALSAAASGAVRARVPLRRALVVNRRLTTLAALVMLGGAIQAAAPPPPGDRAALVRQRLTALREEYASHTRLALAHPGRALVFCRRGREWLREQRVAVQPAALAATYRAHLEALAAVRKKATEEKPKRPPPDAGNGPVAAEAEARTPWDLPL